MDEKLKNVKGINSLLFDHLVEAGFDTARAILSASPDKLAAIPGISLETADRILEQIQREFWSLQADQEQAEPEEANESEEELN